MQQKIKGSYTLYVVELLQENLNEPSNYTFNQ